MGLKKGVNDMYYDHDGMLEILRAKYTVGTRVQLDRMDDPQAPPIGTQGTVLGVDKHGSVMVSWDNGSSLSVLLKDKCHIIKHKKEKLNY